jgi:hypothetical protein
MYLYAISALEEDGNTEYMQTDIQTYMYPPAHRNKPQHNVLCFYVLFSIYFVRMPYLSINNFPASLHELLLIEDP